jgi:hypothetical protein
MPGDAPYLISFGPEAYERGARVREGESLGQMPSFLSDTFLHNELMRRCLVRRQDESLFPRIRQLSKALTPWRIKSIRTLSQTPQNSL